MGLLNKTKCVVIGPMQYADGRDIRNYFKDNLSPLGITVFDHYHKPFMNEFVQETQQTKQFLQQCLENGLYGEIEKYRYEKHSIQTRRRGVGFVIIRSETL